MNQLSKCGADQTRDELRFSSLSSDGRIYTFPCDAGGKVNLGALSERARDNYFYVRAVIGREFSAPSIALVA